MKVRICPSLTFKLFGRFRTRRKKIAAFGLLSFIIFCFMQSLIYEHLISQNFFCSLLVSDESEDIRTEEEYQKIDFNVSCITMNYYGLAKVLNIISNIMGLSNHT